MSDTVFSGQCDYKLVSDVEDDPGVSIIEDDGSKEIHIPNYFISSFGTKILSLVSLPILTHFLSPEEYGLLNIFGTYTIFIHYYDEFNLSPVSTGTHQLIDVVLIALESTGCTETKCGC